MSDEEQRSEDAAAGSAEVESSAPADVVEAPSSPAEDHGPASHGHDEHGHGEDHFAHVLPMWLLLGVLGALIVLTVATVAVTAVDLGSQGNFVVAMVIATIKAVLVMGIFMHMVWDSKFNVVAFTSSFLFVLLFLSMAVLDRFEYRDGIDEWETDQKVNAMQ